MTVYKSKIGLGIVIPVSVILGATAVLMIYQRMWVILFFVLAMLAFIIHTFVTTYYTITEKELKIRCGFLFNKSINVSSIKTIIETNNPLSSPAVSLDRLEIIYNKSEHIMISPKDKMAFIDHVKRLNPNVEVRLKERF